MNRLGIRVLLALLGVACSAGELCAQQTALPMGDPINPPGQPGVAASVPSLPLPSIAKIKLQQDDLNPPPRETAAVISPIVNSEQAQIRQVGYEEVVVPPNYANTSSQSDQWRSTRAPATVLQARGETQSAQQDAGWIPEKQVTPSTQYAHPNGASQRSQEQLGARQLSPELSNRQRQFNSSLPNGASAVAPPVPRIPANRVKSVSWGYPQDQDDPFGQLPSKAFPRTPTPPAPPTTPPTSLPPTPLSVPTPQDPQDPFQQLPGNTNEPTPRPRPRPRPRPDTGIQQPSVPEPGWQDTEPRPLPNGELTPPTELPILPRDRTPVPTNPNQGNQGNGNGNQDNGNNGQSSNEQELIVYPDSIVPGRQRYPGPTSNHEPELEPGQATAIDTSQVIYGDSRQNTQGTQGTQGSGQISGSVLEQYSPGVLSNSTLDIYAPPAAGPQIAQVNYESECCEPCGWRPQLAIGLDPACPNFQPAFYLSLFGGLNHIDDLSGNSPIDGATSSSFNLDDGGGFGFALGQYQGFNLRTEFEYSFRTNDVDQISLAENVGNALTFTDFGLNGELAAHSGMGNIIWQFNGIHSRWVRPYVGAGAGFVFLDANFSRLGQDILANGNDGDSTFAYQLFGGLNVQLNRQMDVFFEYRYFAADSLRLETGFANVNGGVGSVLEDFDYEADNVFFGVRFKF